MSGSELHVEELGTRETAQAFADKYGVRVLPIRIEPDPDNPDKLLKRPLIPAWTRAASTDTSKLEWSGANGYGWLPDKKYVVIDCDSEIAAKRFLRTVGKDDAHTFIVNTPRGFHFVYRSELGINRIGLYPEVDIRGDEKGFLVGPGSSYEGRGWTVLDGCAAEPIDMPSSVERWLTDDGGDRGDSEDLDWHKRVAGTGRNAFLTMLKGSLMRSGVPELEANGAIRGLNSRLPEPLSDRELEATVLAEKSWAVGRIDVELLEMLANSREGVDDAVINQLTWLRNRRRAERMLEAADASFDPDLIVTRPRLETPAWLIEDVFPLVPVTVVVGHGGSGKSLVMQDLMMHLANGAVLWHGHKVVESGPAMWVAGEGDEEVAARWIAFERKAGAEIPDDRFLLYPRSVHLPVDVEVDRLIEEIRARDVGYVVFDTLSQNSAGANENSNSEMADVIAHVQRIYDESGVRAFVIHHSGWTNQDRLRGASAIFDNVRCVMVVDEGHNMTRSKANGVGTAPDGWAIEVETVGDDPRMIVMSGLAVSNVEAIATMAIRSILEDGKEHSGRDLIRPEGSIIRARERALERLLGAGEVEMRVDGRTHLYRLVG